MALSKEGVMAERLLRWKSKDPTWTGVAGRARGAPACRPHQCASNPAKMSATA
jgi:hypothetical protein